MTDQSHVAEGHKKADHMTRNFIGEQTTQDVKDEIILFGQGREHSLGSHLTVPSDQLFVA